MWIIKYNKGNGIREFLNRYRSKKYAQEMCDVENEFKPNIKHWLEEYKSREDILKEAIEYLKNEQKIICYDEEEIEGHEFEFHKQGFKDCIIAFEKFMELKSEGE